VPVGEETLHQLRIVIFRLQPNRANPAGCVVIGEKILRDRVEVVVSG